MVMSSSPSSKPAAKAKNLFGGAVEQPLAVMPITVWNPPSESARPPPRMVGELKRKNPKSKFGEDEDSLLFNVELAAAQSRPSLRILTLGGRKRYPLMRLWLYPFRWLPR